MDVIDLFSGCGGLSLGFIQDGYQVRRAVEFDRSIAKTYQKNHPEVDVIVDDIRNIDQSGVFHQGDADVIIGGPPCQGFSMAGARIRGGFIDDPRNYLFKHYFNVVRTVKPQVFRAAGFLRKSCGSSPTGNCLGERPTTSTTGW